VEITDDGRGGAREGAGTGLAGVRTRVEAHDGVMTLRSPPGGPTTLRIAVPCAS
jgi:signal transduction histidine kinase